ncbi:hypothetical protein HBI56_050250 [Parastagonospora nodorum]|nr:hypothetical protein HBH56_063180 [Parastagonospora nodorum]KAH3931114.1 hypothetical protein HBH54_107120 [Parastagonospora nodorum]KAH3954263.1 hypothetical protein HBH53_022060 [Parastagonospora nodorum]KAH3968031.1 hypothetical protein HBH51_131620 [Parastagonospora nodorum]KAH3999908.1 hypothetical protein HBI10_105510 [Parastagonospora nodorum]
MTVICFARRMLRCHHGVGAVMFPTLFAMQPWNEGCDRSCRPATVIFPLQRGIHDSVPLNDRKAGSPQIPLAPHSFG